MHKNIITMGWVSFFTDTASSMVTPLIPILVVVFLREDVQTLSQIVAFTTFISYAFRVLFGYLGDRLQMTKPFMVSGYLISAISKPLFYFASSWQSVALLQSGERLGKAIRAASKDTLLCAFAKKSQMGKTFGFHKTMDIAGELFGSVLVFVLLFIYGQSEAVIKTIFALTLVPGAVAVLLVTRYVKDAPGKNKGKNKDTRYQWKKQDSRLLPLLMLDFAFIFFVFNTSFLVIQANELGYEIALVPLFFIVLTLVQTLTSYFFGLRIDKAGVTNTLLISYFFGVLTQVSLYFGFIWVGFAFLGLFTVGSINAIRSYISNHAINQSTVFGVFYGGTALFSALGILLTGYLWHNFGSNSAIQVSLIGTVLLTLLLPWVASRKIEL